MQNIFTLRASFYSMAIATIFVVASLLPGQSAQAAELDRIIAVAGEDIILSSELRNSEQEVMRQMRSRGVPLPPPADLRKQVLERLILSRLQTQRARQSGIQANEEDINRALEMIASRNQLDLENFRQALINEGIDYDFYRQQLRDEILINRLKQKEVDSRVSVTDRDVDLFLQAQVKDSGAQYRLRQILIAIPPNSDAQAREAARSKAEALREQLQQGADFIELAQSASDGQQALEGGDLGWIDGHLLPTIFATDIPNMAVGDISPILVSDSGLHIVKLEDSRTAGKRLIAREANVRHILLRPNEIRNPGQTETLIRTLYQQLQDGADFSQLAREHSDDPGSASEGGNLGWQPPENFEPSFRSEIEALDKDGMSEPFRSAFGWHIAQVLGWRERDTTNLQRRAQARNLLRQRRTNEEYDRWLRRLRGDAYVEYRIPTDAQANGGS